MEYAQSQGIKILFLPFFCASSFSAYSITLEYEEERNFMDFVASYFILSQFSLLSLSGFMFKENLKVSFLMSRNGNFYIPSTFSTGEPFSY